MNSPASVRRNTPPRPCRTPLSRRQKSLLCIDLRGRATSRIFCFENSGTLLRSRLACMYSVRKSVGTDTSFFFSVAIRCIPSVTCRSNPRPPPKPSARPRRRAHARPPAAQPVGIRDDRLHLFDRVLQALDHRLRKHPAGCANLDDVRAIFDTSRTLCCTARRRRPLPLRRVKRGGAGFNRSVHR